MRPTLWRLARAFKDIRDPRYVKPRDKNRPVWKEPEIPKHLQHPYTGVSLDFLRLKPKVPRSTLGLPPPRKIKVFPALPAPPKDPIALFTRNQFRYVDRGGLRRRLFSRHNKDALRVGDILQVRFKDPNTDSFEGILLNIRRRGLDTAFLLRNHLTRIGVEMWYKLYSPKISGIDLVQRSEKRARRAKLYFMRQPKHDIGSVEGIVRRWKQSRKLFGGRAIGSETQKIKTLKRKTK